MTKLLPRELTTYDLLKTLAVALMIIDHLVYYMFPEQQWMRVLGRLCVPMWFFLIGYARTRDVPPRLWGGAAVLVLGSVIYGHYIFPVNILATMVVLRFTIDAVMSLFMRSRVSMVICGFALAVLAIPTSLLLEYGTMAYVLGFFGFMIRHAEEKQYGRNFIMNYILFVFLTFLVTQTITHGFVGVDFYGLALGTIIVLFGLMHFKSETISINFPSWLKVTLQFTGRRTLEIYVAHILFLGFLAMFMDDPRFGFMDWKWIPEIW